MPIMDGVTLFKKLRTHFEELKDGHIMSSPKFLAVKERTPSIYALTFDESATTRSNLLSVGFKRVFNDLLLKDIQEIAEDAQQNLDC